VNPDFSLKDSNQAFHKMISHGTEIPSANLTQIIPDLRTIFDEVRQGNVCDINTFPVMIDGPESEPHYWNISAWPIFDDHTAVAEIVLVITDVTDRVRLLNERDDLYATLAHDLRVPLLGAERVLQHLKDGSLAAQAIPKVLESLCNSNAKMLRDVTTLVEVSKYSDQNYTRQMEHIELCQLADEVLADLKPLAEQAKVTVRKDYSSADICLCAHRDGIVRTLSNLVDNALKFTPEFGEVTVAVSGQADKVTLKVTDNGPGIDAETQSRLFRRFWRGLPGRYRASMGFGLYLCRKITEFHGGRLECSSTLGQGATFTVTLPVTCGISCKCAAPGNGKQLTASQECVLPCITTKLRSEPHDHSCR
jgi:signal transduction histidine kinase